MLNKFELKAFINKIVENLKTKELFDSEIFGAIKSIKEKAGEDNVFAAKMLLREVRRDDPKFATILIFIINEVAPKNIKQLILDELNSKYSSDEQKLFLVNILASQGVNFDSEEIRVYLENPDKALNDETARFVDDAMKFPEAQIDFLDFYFASPKEDRSQILESIMTGLEDDKLANVAAILAPTVEDSNIIMYCLDILETSRSLFAIKPLLYLSHYSTNENIKKRAQRILKKFKMSGFYTEEKLLKFYKKINSNFVEPPVFQATFPDGNSNFSLIISRKDTEGKIVAFLIAINIETGPFSCFGFSNLAELEFNTGFKRFFNTEIMVEIPPENGKKLLELSKEKRIALKKRVPYELFSWEKTIGDIETAKKTEDEILSGGLSKTKLSEFQKKIVRNCPFIENWFYSYSTANEFFCELADCALINFETAKGLVKSIACDEKIIKFTKDRIKYLAYLLKLKDCNEFAEAYYSLLFDKEEMIRFNELMLQKSLYQYALYLRTKTASSDKYKKEIDTLFEKIEENWIKK